MHETINIPPSCVTPYDFYHLLVDDALMDVIVRETNYYAAQTIQNSTTKNESRSRAWKPIDGGELKKCFAIVLWFGIVPTPDMKKPWSKDRFYRNEFISKLNPRDRFINILRFLHFSSNETTRTDGLYKIRNIRNMLIRNFQEYMNLGENMVIDETTIPFRGRLFFRQNKPKKSHKYRAKVYKLCTDSGYIYNMGIYSGKGDTKSHSFSVVKNLLENEGGSNILGNGRTLYADNFYSSMKTTQYLNQHRTRYVGTLGSNRKGLPKEIIERKVQKGKVIGLQKNGIKVMIWKDKKEVLMITSVQKYNLDLNDTGKKNWLGENILKPQCVIDYNRARKGIDYSDKMSSYYSVLRKTRKW
uniref:PiggyBac transposable element-derived protein 4 n=2 Tax=Lygus hesperus TaxID=30085 RepID=A0A0A9W581_LYGHE